LQLSPPYFLSFFNELFNKSNSQFIGNRPTVNEEFWNGIAKREPFFARSDTCEALDKRLALANSK
jgi:hypothetical protein